MSRVVSVTEEPSVFISYSKQDQVIARRLVQDLHAKGISVWFDEDEIRPGDLIVERITEALLACDYWLVLLSRNVVGSPAPNIDFAAEFARNNKLPIIAVRLDPTELPRNFETVASIDLYSDYEAGLDELERLLTPHETRVRSENDLTNVTKLAKDLGEGKTIPRGAEFYVATVVAVLTLLATTVGAVPPILGIVGNRPRVYYTVAHYGLVVPPGTDGQQIQKLVEEKGLADPAIQFALINKGDATAHDVEVGAQVSGVVASIFTNPPADSNPVWVQISVAPPKQNDRGGRVSLRDLVPGKSVTVSIQYHSNGSEYTADIVADGQFAKKVPDLDAVPVWSPLQAFKLPLIVLAAGMGLSLFAGFAVAIFRNPRLRIQVTELLESVSPVTAKMIRGISLLLESKGP